MALEFIPFNDFNVYAHIRKQLQAQKYQRKREKMDVWYKKMIPLFEPLKKIHSDKPGLNPIGENKIAPDLIPRRPDQSIV
jgi:hypothetical protein